MEAVIFKVILYVSLTLFTFLFIYNQKHFSRKSKNIERTFFIILLIVQIVRHITYIAMGKYTWLIPFHICNISGILACIWLYTKSSKIQAPLFFLSFMAIAALVYPAVDYSYKNPLYYTFIVDHIVLAFLPFYMIIAYHYVPTIKEMFYSLFGIIGLMMVGLLLNKPFNENYFYLTERPLLPHLPVYIYLLLYFLLLVVCFTLIYNVGKYIISARTKQRA